MREADGAVLEDAPRNCPTGRITLMTTKTLHRAARLTARTSGALFAAAQTASRLDRHAVAAHPLYLAFVATHALHLAVVARYAVVTDGRDLFPGGRDLDDVGGWRTVAAIYTGFAALAHVGRRAIAAPHDPHRSAGRVANGLIAAMFVSTYLGQLRHSRWFAVPAAVIGAATAANLVRQDLKGAAPDSARARASFRPRAPLPARTAASSSPPTRANTSVSRKALDRPAPTP